VSDPKLIANLDSIVKQLQKISATIGVSVGVSDKGGKPKIKSTLDSNEKTRAKNLFKETEQQYENVLGRAFNNARNANAKANAAEFISSLRGTTLITNIEKVKDDIKTLVTRTTTSNIDAYLRTLNQTMSDILASKQNYEPKLDEILTALKALNVSSVSSVIKPQTVIRMFEILLKKMKWEDYKVFIMDSIVRIETIWIDLNKNIQELVRINQDILTNATKKPSKDDVLTKLGTVAGLMAIGVGFAVIVNALVNANLIKPDNVVKVLVVVGAIVALFVGVSLVANKIKNAAIGFGIFSATVLFLIIPMIYAMDKIPLLVFTVGLIKMTFVVAICTVFVAVLSLIGRFTKGSVKESVGGLALLALTIGFLILPLIKHISTFPLEQLKDGMLKITGIILVCIGIMKLASLVDAKQATFSLGGILIFSLLLKFLIVPLLLDMAKLDWKMLLYGVGNAAIAILGLGGIAFLIGLIAKQVGLNMVLGAAVILGLTLIMSYLASTLEKFVKKDWKEIYKGLGLATLAIVLFGLVVTGIGFLVANPLSAIIVGAGLLTILGLSFVAGYLADSLDKFSNKNWAAILAGLKGATKGIVAFGAVVAAMGVIAILGMPIIIAGAGLMMYLANTAGMLAANLEKFADRDWDTIIPGLIGASKGMGLFGAVVAAMGYIIEKFGMDMIESGATAIYELSIVAGLMADNLMEFAFKPWFQIIRGLKQSTIAMAEFSLFVGGVGLFNKIIEKGIDTVYRISDLVGNIAENLMKYADVSAIDFKSIGEGLKFLGEALKVMFFGSLANVGSSILDGITGFFKSDPVSKIKKFEAINSSKIYELGLGLKFMAEGLNSLTKDMDLTNIIKDIGLLSKPVIDLAYGISEFSDAYTKFQAVRMDSDLEQIKNINVENENGLKDTIKQTGQLQIEVLREQLAEIRRTNQLMETLISTSNINNANRQDAVIQQNQNTNTPTTTLSQPAFFTKDNYRNNLKLTAMSIQS